MNLILETLTLLSYRNISECTIAMSPKINCFIGNNGMGKTNIIDAIYHLSFCKSSLNSLDSQIIKHDSDMFMIQGDYLHGENEERIICAVKRRSRKQFTRNKKKYNKFSEHIGLLPLVMISPADDALIQEGSEERRRFLDTAISQYDATYLEYLNNYNTALNNRNEMMKNSKEPDADMLDIYEEQMEQCGDYIHDCRKKFIEDITSQFEHFYQLIAQTEEKIDLQYRSHLSSEEKLGEQLRAVRNRDRMLGYTTKGIHKDEIEITIDQHAIKRTASQGQIKSTLIGMKLAQFMILKKHCTVTPMLLLDDIFDKLDANRVQHIMEIVAGDDFGQIFITDTNRLHIDQLIAKTKCNAKLFEVDYGEVANLTDVK